MMMRVNANTVGAARVASKSSATSVVAPRRAVVVAASKGSESKDVSNAVQSGLAAVCLGVSLLISPIQPALAVLPPDNGAGLIKSFENAIPQPLNAKKESAAAYKDPAVEAKKDTAQYSDVDYTKKASDAIKGGVQNIKEAVTGAADSAKDNASDAASDIKVNANKLSNKVAFLGFGENNLEKAKGAIQEKVGGNIGIQTSNTRENIDRITDSVKGDGMSSLVPLNSGQNGPKSVNAFTTGNAGWMGDKRKNTEPGSAPNTMRPVESDPNSDNKGDPNRPQLFSPENIKNVLLNNDNKLTTSGNASNLSGDPLPANNKISNTVSGKVQQDVDATKNTLRSVKNDGADQIKAGAQDAVEGSKDGVKSVNAFLAGKAGAVKNAVSDKAEDLGDAAKGAVKNVKYGAQDVAEGAKDNIKDAGNQINPAKNVGFFGVGDPNAAKDLQQEKGGNVIDGAKGLNTKYAPNNYVPETGGASGDSFLAGKTSKTEVTDKASDAVDGTKGIFSQIKDAGADAAQSIKDSASKI